MAPGKYTAFSDVRKNVNGGFYEKGKSFDMTKKFEIITTFFAKWESNYPNRPTYSDIARDTKTTHTSVRRFLREFEEAGRIINPDEKNG